MDGNGERSGLGDAGAARRTTAVGGRRGAFICYSHKDKRWLDQLETQLSPVIDDGLDVWSDRRIVPGDRWRQEIAGALAAAKVGVLLVTPDFLASRFIKEQELPVLLAAARNEGLRLLWIAVKASNYKKTAIEQFQAANDPDRPLDEIPAQKRNRAWVEICDKIEKAAHAGEAQAQSMTAIAGPGPATGPSEGVVAPGAVAAGKAPGDRELVGDAPPSRGDGGTTPGTRGVGGAAPFTVPAMPERFVARPEHFEALVTQLLEPDRSRPRAITTALQGGGGFGKTTLAIALCHDERVRRAFRDGILWVELGEQVHDLAGLVSRQIEHLSGDRTEAYAGLTEAAARFRELLGERELLIVLDDLWEREHAQPFLQGGEGCARLIVTRRKDLSVRLGAREPIEVDEMTTDEATQMLLDALRAAGKAAEEPEIPLLEALAYRLGRWPLLIELAGAWLVEGLAYDYSTLGRALQAMEEKLDEQGFTAFDRAEEQQRNAAVARSIAVSLDRLGDRRMRFLELAIFPEDADISFATAARLWQATSGLSGAAGEDILHAIHRL